MTRNKIDSGRMLDCEFVNRFLAFYLLGTEQYSGNLEDYLNDVMIRLQKESKSTIEKCRADFLKAMIYAFKIWEEENFKSIKKLALPLENLNLFFGMNGMGKSSLLQALLLLRQSFWENYKSGLDCLYTNGEIIQLGTGKDTFCQNGLYDSIRISFPI